MLIWVCFLIVIQGIVLVVKLINPNLHFILLETTTAYPVGKIPDVFLTFLGCAGLTILLLTPYKTAQP